MGKWEGALPSWPQQMCRACKVAQLFRSLSKLMRVGFKRAQYIFYIYFGNSKYSNFLLATTISATLLLQFHSSLSRGFINPFLNNDDSASQCKHIIPFNYYNQYVTLVSAFPNTYQAMVVILVNFVFTARYPSDALQR